MAEIYNELGELDSLKQEQIFLKQKYAHFPFSHDEYQGKTIFEAFEETDYNEKEMKEILAQNYIDTHTFDYNGQGVSFDFFKEKRLTTHLKSAGNQIHQSVAQIMHDILKYRDIINRINQKENANLSISGEQKRAGQVSDFYQKTILSRLKSTKKNKSIGFVDQGEIDADLAEFLGIEKEGDTHLNPEIESLVWKYDFFKRVQQSVEKGYVLTYREIEMIEDIINDLQNGEVVLMTGDTGSGKTELAKFLVKLAKFIVKEYMQSEYVFVSGNREMEVSDLTLEKTVTSKSVLDTDTNIVDGSEKDEDSRAVEFMEQLIQTQEFKQRVLEKAKENGKSNEEIQKLKQEMEKVNLLDKKLITEYHLMGVYKAAKLGIPCIIDEVNIIRPEVLMALNDTLTKRAGDTIQLPNALEDITVKKGFCIILTGNDPEQNKDSQSYTSGRYKFDEATYNRLRIYAKNYLNQIIESHKENRLDSHLDQTLDYLEDNELYGTILMMMFQQDTTLNHSGKYGFELMKRDFEGKHIGKQEFFEIMKSFSEAISLIQKSFSNEVIPLQGANSTFSLKDAITRKVFSMRNLITVLKKFKNDTLPIEYHIYNEFVKHTTNTDEQYALLLAFAEFELFGDLVTDNKEASLRNIRRKMRNLKDQKSITLTDIENKVIITKQDMYSKYFGSMDMENDFFEANIDKVQEVQSNQVEETGSWLDENIEITAENLEENITDLQELLRDNESAFSIENFFFLSQFFETLKAEIHNIDTSKYNLLHSLLHRITNAFDEVDNNGLDEQVIMSLAQEIQHNK